MEVYYREDDEVWVGDLTFIKLSESERRLSDFDRKNWPDKFTAEMTHKPYSSFICFDTAWRKTWPRKSLHLEDATFEGICREHIKVKGKDGKDYDFYTEKPIWVETTISVATACKKNKTEEELASEKKAREDSKALNEAFNEMMKSDTIQFGNLTE